MTELINKTKKQISVLMLFMMMMIGCCSFVSPCTAYAEANSDISKFEVSVHGEGLTVKGMENDSDTAWNNFFKKYKKFIIGISGMGTITMVGCFIVCFIKLGASVGNPQARQQALTGVLWSGIGTAGLGAVSFIVGIIYSSLK